MWPAQVQHGCYKAVCRRVCSSLHRRVLGADDGRSVQRRRSCSESTCEMHSRRLGEAQGELPDQHLLPGRLHLERPDGPQRRHPLARPRLAQRATSRACKVDFDQYSTNQKFLGLKSLVLDNLTQDPSGIHETVSMRFFERLGIPTPRETHVKLYVNSEYIGLYALVESVDKEFLSARLRRRSATTRRTTAGSTSSCGRITGCFTDLGTDLRRDQAALRRDDARVEVGRGEVPADPGADHARQPDAGGSLRRGDRTALRSSRASSASSPRRRISATPTASSAPSASTTSTCIASRTRSKHVLIAWDTDNTFWGPTFPIKPDDDQRADAEVDAHPGVQRAVVLGAGARQRAGRSGRLARHRDHPAACRLIDEAMKRTSTSRTRTTATKAKPARCCRSRTIASPT